MTGTHEVDVPVLIVGGGGSGLTASIFLSDLGVDSLLVERHASTSKQPRAHLLNGRTMEVLGQHGIAEDVYELGAPADNCGAMVWLTSLGGDEPFDRKVLYRTAAYGGGDLESRYTNACAYRHGNLGQRWLEPLLVEHAERRRPGSVLFGHELTAFESTVDGVVSTILDRQRGRTFTVRSRYLVGADGGKTIGAALGVPMHGTPTFLEWVSLHVRSDFSEFVPYDDAVVNRVSSLSDSGRLEHCGVVPMGPTKWGRHSEEWTIMFCVTPGVDRGDDDEATVAKVRQILKLPTGHPMQVYSVNRWPVEGRVAQRFRVDSTFLVGDAAHRHPPSGALGLNTGIQDSHNLAWKLAAVLHGQAGPELLDSYQAERMPVARDVVERALFSLFNQIAMTAGTGVVPGAEPAWNRAQLTALFAEGRDGETRRALLAEYFNTNRITTAHLDMEMGFDYADAGFVVPDGTPRTPPDPTGTDYVQTARPGHRVPHAWLCRAGQPVATHDLVTPGSFVLLAAENGQPWLDAARSRGQDVVAYRVGTGLELEDPDGAWARLRGHGQDGAVLVRPDGFVVMRHANALRAEDDLCEALRIALGHQVQVGVS